MVSMASPSRILFIFCMGKPFRCSHSAWPGEKSACSFLMRIPTRSAPYHWPGQISPSLILFWLSLPAKLCYVLVTYNSSLSFFGRITNGSARHRSTPYAPGMFVCSSKLSRAVMTPSLTHALDLPFCLLILHRFAEKGT